MYDEVDENMNNTNAVNGSDEREFAEPVQVETYEPHPDNGKLSDRPDATRWVIKEDVPGVLRCVKLRRDSVDNVYISEVADLRKAWHLPAKHFLLSTSYEPYIDRQWYVVLGEGERGVHIDAVRQLYFGEGYIEIRDDKTAEDGVVPFPALRKARISSRLTDGLAVVGGNAAMVEASGSSHPDSSYYVLRDTEGRDASYWVDSDIWVTNPDGSKVACSVCGHHIYRDQGHIWRGEPRHHDLAICRALMMQDKTTIPDIPPQAGGALVTGSAGVGKSTLIEDLKTNGFFAMEGDNFGRSEDRKMSDMEKYSRWVRSEMEELDAGTSTDLDAVLDAMGASMAALSLFPTGVVEDAHQEYVDSQAERNRPIHWWRAIIDELVAAHEDADHTTSIEIYADRYEKRGGKPDVWNMDWIVDVEMMKQLIAQDNVIAVIGSNWDDLVALGRWARSNGQRWYHVLGNPEWMEINWRTRASRWHESGTAPHGIKDIPYREIWPREYFRAFDALRNGATLVANDGKKLDFRWFV